MFQNFTQFLILLETTSSLRGKHGHVHFIINMRHVTRLSRLSVLFLIDFIIQFYHGSKVLSETDRFQLLLRTSMRTVEMQHAAKLWIHVSVELSE